MSVGPNGEAPLKRIFRVVTGSTPKSGEVGFWNGEITWVTPEDLSACDGHEITDSVRKITPEGYASCSTSRVPEGSIVLSTRAPIGYVALAAVATCFNQGCKALVPLGSENSRYWLHALGAARQRLQSFGRGSTYDELGTRELKDYKILWPVRSSQDGIADYLDAETARIDTLIDRKQCFIDLLLEKRTALITYAVTKGLDPTAEMKDSEVEWIGWIPAHWTAVQLGQLLSRITYGFTNPMPVARDGPYMLTANDIGDGKVLYSSARRTTLDAYTRELTDKSRPRRGDILLTKDGSLGRTAIAGETPACVNQSVAVLRVGPSKALPEFLQIALSAHNYQDRMILEAGGTAIKHIYITRLAKMPIALPPWDEQLAIVSRAREDMSGTDDLVAKTRRSIDLLREYRTALISAAVTGQIDIPGTETAEDIA